MDFRLLLFCPVSVRGRSVRLIVVVCYCFVSFPLGVALSLIGCPWSRFRNCHFCCDWSGSNWLSKCRLLFVTSAMWVSSLIGYQCHMSVPGWGVFNSLRSWISLSAKTSLKLETDTERLMSDIIESLKRSFYWPRCKFYSLSLWLRFYQFPHHAPSVRPRQIGVVGRIEFLYFRRDSTCYNSFLL